MANAVLSCTFIDSFSVMNISLGVLLAPYRVDYYNHLHDDCDCEVFFLQRGFEGQLYSSEGVEAKCSYTPNYLRTIRLGKNRRFVVGLKKLLCHKEIENVIVPEFSILTLQVILLKLIFRFKFNIICQCDDSYDMLSGGKSFSRFHVLARKICMPFMKQIILVDSRSVKWYQGRYGKGIWMPIIRDVSKLDANAEKVASASFSFRREYDLEGKLVLLFVARLIELKNLSSLLKACTGLDRPYVLLVVGDGKMRNSWEKEASDLGVSGVFLGRKNDIELEAIYRSSDILILPSHIEAFGAVTNEALIHGCRCVISKNAGSSCLVEDGFNGYVCDPYSVDDIREKIMLASNLNNSSGKSLMKKSFDDYFADVVTLLTRC